MSTVNTDIPAIKRTCLGISIAFTATTLICAVSSQQVFAQATEKKLAGNSSGEIALINAVLLDGTGVKRKDKQTILIQKNRIIAVGPTETTPVPASFETKDLAGKTVTPGFVMMHEHLFYPIGFDASDLTKFNFSSTVVTFPAMYLAGGVTTMRTAGTMSPYADINTRMAIEKGTVIGPDMDVTAPYVDGPMATFTQMRATPSIADVARFVDYWSAEGATSYKAYMNITPPQLSALTKQAKLKKQKVTGHLCATTYEEAIAAGIDNLEHGFWAATDFVENKTVGSCPDPQTAFVSLAKTKDDDPKLAKLIDLLIAKKVVLTSTNAVFETIINHLGSGYSPAPALAMLPQGLREKIQADYIAPVGFISPEVISRNNALFKKIVGWEKKFYDAGGTLTLGTDPTGNGSILPGYGTQRAMEILASTGIPVEDVIKIGSLNGARFLGRDKDIGSIEVGKRADLVIFRAKLEKPSDFKMGNVESVMKAGTIYSSKALLESVSGQVGYK
jgi:cytosine/adenosine deaminase-related metal-dependent hydrolase